MNRRKIQRRLALVAFLISILGLITFSLFIFEESLQVITFGTWPAQNAGDWPLVLEGTDLLESTNVGMKTVNYCIGWLQPLAFFSYRAYGKSTDYYIRALRAKVFANSPESFDGRHVSVNFTPATVRKVDGAYHYINRRVVVISDKSFALRPFHVEGTVRVVDGQVHIIKSILSFSK